MAPKQRYGSDWQEVLGAFLRLGLTSFGGPVAHVGYFRREFVERRRWLSEAEFGQWLALCQVLPGPASSQLGLAIGRLRAGTSGALAAFAGFTLPSALVMLLFALSLAHLPDGLLATTIHGLKLLALAVVAQAVLGMARSFCSGPALASVAAATVAAVLMVEGVMVQLLAIGLGALVGLRVADAPPPSAPPSAPMAGPLPAPGGRASAGLPWWLALGGLWLLLAAGAATLGGVWVFAEAIYRSGALVFGGGHVVLPLLEQGVVASGWVTPEAFLAGYGLAQILPGPLFTLASFLGAQALPAQPLVGALLATGLIFLPGFLLLLAVLPAWSTLTSGPTGWRALAGINAAVVGLLGAVLYDPIWRSAVAGPVDVAIALGGFVLLHSWRLSPLWVAVWCVAGAWLAGWLPGG